MNLNLNDHHLELEYPCMWNFKIIGPDAMALRAAVTAIVVDRRHSLAVSHRSTGSKYVSMTLDLKVTSDEDRHAIFHALKRHYAVKMVL